MSFGLAVLYMEVVERTEWIKETEGGRGKIRTKRGQRAFGDRGP
jgi:hypothetical protein